MASGDTHLMREAISMQSEADSSHHNDPERRHPLDHVITKRLDGVDGAARDVASARDADHEWREGGWQTIRANLLADSPQRAPRVLLVVHVPAIVRTKARPTMRPTMKPMTRPIRCTQMHSDARRCMQMHADAFRCIQMHAERRRWRRTSAPRQRAERATSAPSRADGARGHAGRSQCRSCPQTCQRPRAAALC